MLSPGSRVILAGIVRQRLRAERHRWTLDGLPEPAWARELDAFADALTVYESHAVTRRKELHAAASRRWRARLAAERARERGAFTT